MLTKRVLTRERTTLFKTEKLDVATLRFRPGLGAECECSEHENGAMNDQEKRLK